MTTSTIPELRAAVESAAGDSERLSALLALGTGLTKNYPPEALALGSESLALAERINHKQGIAEAHHLMGAANRELGNYQLALEQLERARSAYEDLGDRSNVACVLRVAGTAWYYLSDFARTLESDRAALAIYEELGDRRGVMHTLINIAGTNVDLGEYPQAMEQFQQVRSYCEEHDDTECIAAATANIARVYNRIGDYGRSMENYQSAIALYERLGNRVSVARHTNSIGDIYKDLGEYAKALEFFQTSLDMSEALGERWSIAAATRSIGSIYFELGEYEKALVYYKSGYALMSELGDGQSIASSMGDLGKVHARLGDYPKALEWHKSGLALAEEIGDRNSIAFRMYYIGTDYQELGEYATALTWFQAGLALKEELGDLGGIAAYLASLGSIYAAPGFEEYNPTHAEKLLHRALELCVESGLKPLQADILHGLAELYQQQGKWEEAHQHITRHYALKEEIQSHEAHKKLQQLEHIKQIAEMEKQRAIDQAEAGAAKLRAQLLESQLEHKQQQLASTAIHVARQTELLGRFRTDLRRILHQSGDAMQLARQIDEKLKELPGESIDWAKFEAEFQQTYPEFRTKLVEKYPDLTKTEVRICSLVRLKLISSDIAQLLSVTDRNVELHRYNIRKKLGLTREQDLAEVLAAI